MSSEITGEKVIASSVLNYRELQQGEEERKVMIGYVAVVKVAHAVTRLECDFPSNGSQSIADLNQIHAKCPSIFRRADGSVRPDQFWFNDGGFDHSCDNAEVQFRVAEHHIAHDLDRSVVTQRAAGDSYANPAERYASIPAFCAAMTQVLIVMLQSEWCRDSSAVESP